MAEVLTWFPGARFNHNVAPLDPEDAEMIRATPKVYIWNVSTREFIDYKGALGKFTIPACTDGAEVSKPLVLDGWLMETAVDQVDGFTVTYKWLKTSGKKQALDLVGIGPQKTAEQDLTKYGVFISAGPQPTRDEIDAATAKWHAYCAELVREADEKFQVNGGMETGDDGRARPSITIDHIRASKVLRADRPWAKVQLAMAECPACGVPVKPGVAFCTNGDIIDEAKARIARPWLFQTQEVHRTRKEA